MKLNHDCVRDLLLYLENNLEYGKGININKLSLNDYPQNDLLYTAEKLTEANFINSVIRWNMNSAHIIVVKSITYKGHEFLDTIRDKTVWENTKSKASKFASISLPIIQQIASSFIQSKLGL